LRINKFLIDLDILHSNNQMIHIHQASTVNTMLNGASEYCSVRTIIKVCQDLGILLYNFFNDAIFVDLEEEID